jgi:hypothetical protein
MKKIIAAAVATAFAVPAFAADITLSGDLEMRYVMEDGEGLYNVYDDADITVTATEELANGMTVTAKVGVEDTQTSAAGDVELAISGEFGTIALGEVDPAVNQVDELGSFSEFAGGAGNPGLAASGAVAATNTISWTLPTLVSGLTVIVSNGTPDAGSSAGVDDEQQTESAAVKYVAGNLTVAAGTISQDDQAYDPTYVGFSYSMNGLTVGYDSTSEDGALNIDTDSTGLKYAMGDATIYGEVSNTETAGASVKDSLYGVKYAVGGGLNLIVEGKNSDTAGADSTTVGVLYAF